MSLKAFHLFFIVASTIMAGGFGGWCLSQYSFSQESWLLGMGIGSFLVMAGLMLYLPWFIRKYRAFSYLTLVLCLGSSFLSRSAEACSVCFGDPNSPLVKAANEGILFLMSVISAVLVGFAGLFLFWIWRGKQQQRLVS